MWTSLSNLLSSAVLILAASPCTALPSPSPSSTPTIPWPAKFTAIRNYILSLPDTTAIPGFSSGPTLSQSFPDGTCYQVRFYNWDCTYPILYKTRGVVNWLDSIAPTLATSVPSTSWMPTRSYIQGAYTDPTDNWAFYGASRLAFGNCGNRGPQSACGKTFCVDKQGKNAGSGGVPIPAGQSAVLDPNDRVALCSWLRVNGTGTGK